MRKLFPIIAVLFCAIAVMAGPPHHHGGHGGHRHYHHYHHCGPGYYYGSRGLGIAYGVTGIVANSLAIANNLVGGVIGPVYTTPVYTTPAPVYTTPVYQQPVAIPAPVPVYTPPVCAPTPVYVGPRGYPQPIIETHRVIVNQYYPRSAPAVRYAPTVIYP